MVQPSTLPRVIATAADREDSCDCQHWDQSHQHSRHSGSLNPTADSSNAESRRGTADDPTHAGWLWGAVEAESERGSIAGWDAQSQHFEPVRHLLGSTAFESGRAAGRKADLDEAVEAALAGEAPSVE